MTNEDRIAAIEELRHLLGDIDDAKVTEILALEPTVTELQTAVLWANGKEDIVATRGGSLSGKTAQIYEILIAGEEEEEH